MFPKITQQYFFLKELELMLFLETYRFRMSAFELDIQKDSRMDGT